MRVTNGGSDGWLGLNGERTRQRTHAACESDGIQSGWSRGKKSASLIKRLISERVMSRVACGKRRVRETNKTNRRRLFYNHSRELSIIVMSGGGLETIITGNGLTRGKQPREGG